MAPTTSSIGTWGSTRCWYNKSIGRDFSCYGNNLSSLEGLSNNIDAFLVDWAKDLPLMQAVMTVKRMIVYNAPEIVENIIDKYNEVLPHERLACAAELIRAGYRKNAEW